jgi:hypothetical protein
LKQQFGPEEIGWWLRGVPLAVRKDVSTRFEEDGGRRGGKEHYFTLIHYRAIVTHNWQVFDKIFGYGKKNVGKEKGTDWMRELNEFRNAVAHATSGVHISIEELGAIGRYHDWLENRIENPDAESETQEMATGSPE